MAGDDVVDEVIESERIGDEPFNLFRISCSYEDKSWRFLRAGDLSGLTISFKPTWTKYETDIISIDVLVSLFCMWRATYPLDYFGQLTTNVSYYEEFPVLDYVLDNRNIDHWHWESRKRDTSEQSILIGTRKMSCSLVVALKFDIDVKLGLSSSSIFTHWWRKQTSY